MDTRPDTLSPDQFQAVYAELRHIAAIHLSRSAPHPTLQPTVLVHEAYLRLSGHGWSSRSHLLASASRAMRHYLVDYLRTKTAQKRDGAWQRVELPDSLADPSANGLQRALEVDALLDRLAQEDPRKASVVEMRFFGGLEFQEIADELGVSLITVKRDWLFSRAWLLQAMSGGGEQ